MSDFSDFYSANLQESKLNTVMFVVACSRDANAFDWSCKKNIFFFKFFVGSAQSGRVGQACVISALC